MPSGPLVLRQAIYLLPSMLQDEEHSLSVQPRVAPYCGILLESYMLLSLLLPRLSVNRVPSPLWHHSFSCPQFTFLNLTSVIFFSSNCADCFLNPQIDFLIVQNDLMLI